MITLEQSEKLEEWSQYFVYGDEGVVGLKKNTPKKVIKEFKEWYKKTYPPVTNDDASEIPNN